MSCYHGSKISGSQQFFSTETALALSNDVWATVLFVSAVMHRKVMHTGQIFRSFLYHN